MVGPYSGHPPVGLAGGRPPDSVGSTNARPRLESTTFPPFARLALSYAIGVAGDVFVTVSLADTLFFSATTSQARPKVLLYLLLTLAP